MIYGTRAGVGAGSGIGLPIIGKLLGHSNFKTTERYAHLAADPLQRASDAISGASAKAMGENPDSILGQTPSNDRTPQAHIHFPNWRTPRSALFASCWLAMLRTIAQPIHCHCANNAAYINNRLPKIPTIAGTAHRRRSVRSAITTNSGNDTILKRAIEVNPAGPPHRVR